MEFFIDELINSGVTYIPPFCGCSESVTDSAIDVSRTPEEDEKEGAKERRRRPSIIVTSLQEAENASFEDRTIFSLKFIKSVFFHCIFVD